MAIVFIRTVIVFVVLILSMMGKRQLGELELSEVVTFFLISMWHRTRFRTSEYPFLTDCCGNRAAVLRNFISGAIVKSVRFRAMVCGKSEHTHRKRKNNSVGDGAMPLHRRRAYGGPEKRHYRRKQVKYAFDGRDPHRPALCHRKSPSAADLAVQLAISPYPTRLSAAAG